MTQHLSFPQSYEAVRLSVLTFRQLTTSQIRRLHYQTGTPKGRSNRCHRALLRLVDLGAIALTPYALGGNDGGSSEHVYQPPKATTKQPDLHRLDISELYVLLKERQLVQEMDFDYYPEPMSNTRVGHILLKPDAYLNLRVDGHEDIFFIEVDRGEEHEAQLLEKMRRYQNAALAWPKDRTFPRILWTAPHATGLNYLKMAIRKMKYPQLFDVVLFDEAVEKLTRG